MKQIARIKTIKRGLPVLELLPSYLFSYFLLFFIRRNLRNNDKDLVIVTNEHLSEFQEVLNTALCDLLRSYYVEPSMKELQKNPARFKTLLVNGRKFKVNYRMSIHGRMAYAIYTFIALVNEAKLEDTCVYIEYK